MKFRDEEQKKEYISPQIILYHIQPVTLLAGSDKNLLIDEEEYIDDEGEIV